MAPTTPEPATGPLETGTAALPPLQIGRREWGQVELAEAIRKDRLTHAEKKLVRDFLWTLGFKTVKTQLRTGKMASASAAIGRPIQWRYDDERLLRESESHRDELAAEVLLKADSIFFDNVHNWNPEKGAALTTYFVGACKQAFKGAYATWTNARDRRFLTTYEIAAAPWLDPNYSRAFADQIENEETVAQVFGIANANQRLVLGYLYQGYSQVDTAEELGITPKAVERRLSELRKKVLLAVGAGKISPPDSFTSSPSPRRLAGQMKI